MQDTPTSPEADPQGMAEDFVTAAGAVLATDAIDKINAGAALTHALYHLPVDKIKALLQDATPGFVDTFTRAQSIYGVGGRG